MRRHAEPLAALFVAASAVAGCSILSQLFAGSPGPSFLAGFDIRSGDPGGTVISKTVALIADSHAHYLWGEPTFLQTNIADRVSPSAIRTPQADLWGPSTERWFLDRTFKSLPTIHLGDATDIACIDEYDAFLTLMTEHKQSMITQMRKDPTARGPLSWFQAPGNHDAYFYGNYHDFKDDWSRACSGRILTKSEFVKRYLAGLAAQTGLDGTPDAVPAPLAQFFADKSRRIDQVQTGSSDGMLASIAWFESAYAAWTSYVVQELDLTEPKQARRVVGILLDTAVYDSPPVLVPWYSGSINAGLTGDISDDEAKIVREWAHAEHARGAVIVLMGHHPYSSLTDRAKRLLDDLHANYGAVLYISAHDHSGKWNVDGQGAKVWTELNIGALVDEPIEARDLRLSVSPTDNRIVIKSQLRRLDVLLNTGAGVDMPACSKLSSLWDAPPNSGDYYLSYKDTGEVAIARTQTRILSVLLSSWQRYFGFLHSKGQWPPGWGPYETLNSEANYALFQKPAEQIAELAKLSHSTPLPTGAADETTRTALNRFRICEGWWGSKYELLRRRISDVDDWGLVLPKE